MDSELPAVNTAQLETPVFHRDHNEPPSSQQSVTNRCSTSRSFDQNFAQFPSVEVPLGTPIRFGPMPYAEPCTIITDVNHNDNTYHTLETPQQVSSRSERYSNFISPMPVVYPHFDPAFFHRNQIASQPTDHHDDYTANGTELSRFFLLNLQNQLLQTSIHQLCHEKYLCSRRSRRLPLRLAVQVQSLRLSLHLRIWQNELFQRTMTRKPR